MEELYQKKKKSLHDLDNHDGMTTYLESHTLECELNGQI